MLTEWPPAQNPCFTIGHCPHNIDMGYFAFHKLPWRSNQKNSFSHAWDAIVVAYDVSKLSWSDLLQLSFGQTSTSTLVRVGEEALTKWKKVGRVRSFQYTCPHACDLQSAWPYCSWRSSAIVVSTHPHVKKLIYSGDVEATEDVPSSAWNL